jgi:hypothetical protein
MLRSLPTPRVKASWVKGGKVAQNVAVGVAGLFIPVLWFGMDFQGAADTEAGRSMRETNTCRPLRCNAAQYSSRRRRYTDTRRRTANAQGSAAVSRVVPSVRSEACSGRRARALLGGARSASIFRLPEPSDCHAQQRPQTDR